MDDQNAAPSVSRRGFLGGGIVALTAAAPVAFTTSHKDTATGGPTTSPTPTTRTT